MGPAVLLSVAPWRAHSKHKEPFHEGTRRQPGSATIGIDIGKNTFHLIGLDEQGAIVLRQKMSRGQVVVRLANMPPCLVGMEACVGAHHLSRQLLALGHDVTLVPGQFVKPSEKVYGIPPEQVSVPPAAPNTAITKTANRS
jgi:hypothetical protein